MAAHKCKYGDSISEIQSDVASLAGKFDTFADFIREDIKQGRETDERQFKLIAEQGERLATVEAGIGEIKEKLTNGGIKATTTPDKSLGLWDTIAATKKKYLLLIFVVGSTGFKFLLDLLDKIIHTVQIYAATL